VNGSDIPRRGVLGSAVLALLGLVSGETRAEASAAGGSEQQLPERAVERIIEAIAELRLELRTQRQFTEIDAIRDAQKQFLRTNAKFPDFIEVGSDLWLPCTTGTCVGNSR